MAQIQGDDGTPSGFTPDPAKTFGVWGDAGSPGAFGGGGNGILGSSKYSSGVAGFTLSARLNAAGVFGLGPVGVCGYATNANSFPGGTVGVYGSGANPFRPAGGIGVMGQSDTEVGVYGESVSNAGVAAFSSQGPGVRAVSVRGTGVFGVSPDTGVLGWGGSLAALFIGEVEVTGNLWKAGGGFVIDHPRAPARKLLRHSFVESPDRKNVYDGVVRCNARGEAIVRLPDWFEALNGDYRYQLTAVGKPAPNLFVASGIKGNRFVIAGGVKNLVISWQVTGVRKDAWAMRHRLVVEENKTATRRGKLLHPEAHGAARHRGFHYSVAEEARKLLVPRRKRPAGRRRKKRS